MESFQSIQQYESDRWKKLAQNMFLIISPFFASFAIYNLYRHNYSLWIVNLIMFLSQILFWFLSTKTLNYQRYFRIDLILIALNFYHNVYQSMQMPEYILWVCTFPIASFILAKYKEAILWSVIFLVFIFIELVVLYLLFDFSIGSGIIHRVIAVYALISFAMGNGDKVRLRLLDNLMLYEKKLIEEKQVAEKAREVAEDASEYKSRFVAVMSHEIRNPLSVIIGMVDLITLETSEHAKEEYLSIIRDSSNHLQSLINNILDFSRMEEGKLEFHNGEFSIRQLMRSVEKSFASQFSQKGLYLHMTVDDNVPESLIGDFIRIRQIMVNLIDNAKKFTNSGGVAVRIKCENDDRNEWANVLIHVEDTGIGVSQDRIRDIFHAYEQINRNTLPTQGAGLGLTICRYIVEGMNGKIDVRSIPDEGTVFTIKLPLKIHENHMHKTTDIQHSVHEKSSYTILVAEDNPAVQLFLSMSLNKAGHTVTIAHNGKEVLDYLESNKYDCILMDIDMPVLDGIKAASMIRSGDAGNSCRNLPIIALSGYIASPGSPICDKTIFNDFIQKPVSMRSLLKIIDKTMDSGK